MTDEQQKHITRLNEVFKNLNYQKYANGVIEHKTNLWEIDILPLLYNMRDEVMDQWNYIQTAIDAIEAKNI